MKVLSRVFRGKFVHALRRAYVRDELDLAGATATLRAPAAWRAFVNGLFDTDWVVYAKPAFGGAAAVLRYLGRYTHRVAISNHRLIAFDGERVTFRWKDYAHGDQWRTMTLTALEFLRRFVQHVLPRGFVRIRQFGYLANARRTVRLALARTLLAQPSSSRADVASSSSACWKCPRCGAPIIVRPILTVFQLAAWVRLDFIMTGGSSANPPSGSDVPTHATVTPCFCALRIPLTTGTRARRPDAAPADRLPLGDHPSPIRVVGPSELPGCSSIARPPRQRLPSSLVIESASASVEWPARSSWAEALPMNASDYTGPIANVSQRYVSMEDAHTGPRARVHTVTANRPVP